MMKYSKEWFAEKGAKGGSSRTEAKRNSSRRNLLSTPAHLKRAQRMRESGRPNLPGPADVPELP